MINKKLVKNLYCEKCGAKLQNGSNFCHVCGHRVRDVEIIIKEKTPIEPNEEIEPSKEIVKKEDVNVYDENSEIETKNQNEKFNFTDFFNNKREEIKSSSPLTADNETSTKLDSKIVEEKKSIVESDIVEENPKKVNPMINIKNFIKYMGEEENYDVLFGKNAELSIAEPESESEQKIEIEKQNDNISESKKGTITNFEKSKEDNREDNKKESFISKIDTFLKEEDEDDLLDLSPDEYSEIVFGRNSKADIENFKKEKEHSKNITKKSIDLNDDSAKKNNSLNKIDITNDEYFTDFEKTDTKTIRYSKKVINSKLNKIEDEEPSDDEFYEDLNIIQEDISDSDYDSKQNDEKNVNIFKKIFEFFGNIIRSIFEFFRNIFKFFNINNNSKRNKSKNLEEDNVDIIITKPVQSASDTMPLIFTEEEKKILNREINKREKAIEKSNKKMAPFIRKLIKSGAKVRIPLIILSFFISFFTISMVVKNRVFIIILGILKFLGIYIAISVATNSAFKSIELKLKRTVVSLFVLIQTLIYQIMDMIYIVFTLEVSETSEAILYVFSPKIISILFLVITGLFLLIINYAKIRERDGVVLFLGYYIIVSVAITLMIILFALLFISIISTLFMNKMF